MRAEASASSISSFHESTRQVRLRGTDRVIPSLKSVARMLREKIFNGIGCFEHILVSCLCFIVLADVAQANNNLQILSTQGGLRLSWSAGATTYNPEFTDALGSGSWVAITQQATITGGVKFVTFPAANHTRFFRLRAPGPTAPVLSNVIASPNLTFGDRTTFSFDFLDPDCDIVSLVVTRSNVFGFTSETLPAALMNLTFTDGHVSIPLLADRVAFGTNSFTVQLMDSHGLVSAPVAFKVALTGQGGGGSAPTSLGFVVPNLRLVEGYDDIRVVGRDGRPM